MRHLLTLFDVTRDEVEGLFEHAARLKKALNLSKRITPLVGKVLALVFEKPSLRTRVSFQAGMAQLGGTSLFLSGTEVGLGARESIADCARTLSEYVDGVVLRVFAQQCVEDFAAHSRVPVINGLSDLYHPCQALADLYTLKEVYGTLKGRTLAFVGDGNNIARSLAIICCLLGVRYRHAAPPGYRLGGGFLEQLRQRFPNADIDVEITPQNAVARADAVYTDVWTSMGQEAERSDRRQAFAGYQVNGELLAKAPRGAILMHCLPAHRGEEITDEVIDGERSVVFQQAGNRMHVQKALLHWLLGGVALSAGRPAARSGKPRPLASNGKVRPASRSQKRPRRKPS